MSSTVFFNSDNRINRGELISFFWEVIKIVVIALVIIVPVRYFLFQPFFVRGASMEDNFHNGDYVLIDELSYRFREPERGEVVIFRFPHDASQFYIKRIIGLPDEEVQISGNEVVVFNKENPQGFILDELAYLDPDKPTLGSFRVSLDEDDYFMLGDNRPNSSDSRFWGPINKKMIRGRVFFRAWPLNKISSVKGAEYLWPEMLPASTPLL